MDKLKKLKQANDRLKSISKSIADLTVEKSKTQKIFDALKAEIQAQMEADGVNDLHSAECSTKIKQTPRKLLITDEAKIPQDFWIDQKPKLDKRELLKQRKEREIPGCELSNGGQTLQVTFRDL